MTAVDCLKSLKTFIEREVASSVLLKKENFSPDNPEYVHPYVALITLPHKNFMPVNFQVPHILIGLTNGNEDKDENLLSIRVQFATYGGDIAFQEDANLPDSDGYIDLLNLIEKTKGKLIQAAVIDGCGVVSRPITYGIYDEQITYPYWYGYMTFDLQIQITQRQMTEFDQRKITHFL